MDFLASDPPNSSTLTTGLCGPLCPVPHPCFSALWLQSTLWRAWQGLLPRLSLAGTGVRNSEEEGGRRPRCRTPGLLRLHSPAPLLLLPHCCCFCKPVVLLPAPLWAVGEWCRREALGSSSPAPRPPTLPDLPSGAPGGAEDGQGRAVESGVEGC